MPPHVLVGRRRDLLQCLLHLVLAEVALAGVERRAHRLGAEGLRHGHERDLLGPAAAAAGRRGDPPAHLSDAGGDAGAIRHG
jgi:hypothetical protein